jgi:two-component system chemotaxis response regulator CheY
MKRCMIVDDSSVVRKVAKRILAGPDLVVVEASNGRQAIEMCSAEMPNLIMVEGSLHDMPTVDFIRHVMTLSATVKPNVIVCFSQFDVAAIMRAKRAGASGYVLKPFNRSHLLERFRGATLAA